MESNKTKWHFEFFLNRTPTVCADVQYEQLVLTDMGSASSFWGSQQMLSSLSPSADGPEPEGHVGQTVGWVPLALVSSSIR